MKIYTREKFMELPEGTLFAKGKQWYFGSIEVKCETLCYNGKASDFYTRSLTWVDAHDSGEAFDRLELMLTKGASFPMEEDISRDGCFEPDDLFLVYELADLAELAEVIQEAIAACPPPTT